MSLVPVEATRTLRAAFHDRRAALAVALTLAVGIGATVATFTVVDAVVLRPLPFPNPEALVVVRQTRPDNGAPFAVTAHDYAAWREESSALSELGAFRSSRVNIGEATAPSWVVATRVSIGFFRALGVSPLVGRVFTTEEDAGGGAAVAVISEDLWRRRFAGARLEGLRLTINGVAHEVVGVMPDGFRFPPQCQVWTPLALDPAREERGNHTMAVVARLAPGRTVAQARAELDTIAGRMAERYPEVSRGWGIVIEPLAELLARGPRPALLLLLGATLCALLIACVNVGLLLLARAVRRRQEVALRVAIGASRTRIFWQFLGEAEALALAGGAGALLVVLWISDALVGSVPPALLVKGDLRLGGAVFAFTVAVAVVTGLVLGLPAAVAATRVRSTDAMHGQPGVMRPREGRVGRWLVVAELALAVVLLVGAGLMARTFSRLAGTDPGFDPSGVVTVTIAPTGSDGLGPTARRQVYADLVARVAALDGVSAVGAIGDLPVVGASNTQVIAIEGSRERARATLRVVTPGYFRAMGIPVTRGRLFPPDEITQAPGPGVVMINETMARSFWPGQDPVGRHLALYADEQTPRPWMTVAGVVGDVRTLGLGTGIVPEFYMPHAQLPAPAMSIVARADGDPRRLVPALRQVVGATPGFGIRGVSTMDDHIAESITPERTRTALVLVVALVATTLAVLGLYGLTSWGVSRRRHEFGVRLALGAERRQLIGGVLAWTLRIVAAGTVLGVLGAVVVWGLLARSLTAVGPVDPFVITAVALAMGAVVVVAGYAPARRAARVDPAHILRHE